MQILQQPIVLTEEEKHIALFCLLRSLRSRLYKQPPVPPLLKTKSIAEQNPQFFLGSTVKALPKELPIA